VGLEAKNAPNSQRGNTCLAIRRRLPVACESPGRTFQRFGEHLFNCLIGQRQQLRSLDVTTPSMRRKFLPRNSSLLRVSARLCVAGLMAAFTFVIVPVSFGEQPAASPAPTAASFMDRETLTGDWSELVRRCVTTARDIGRERRCLTELERNVSGGQRLKVESLARLSKC
jgi:hypothetical protein